MENLYRLSNLTGIPIRLFKQEDANIICHNYYPPNMDVSPVSASFLTEIFTHAKDEYHPFVFNNNDEYIIGAFRLSNLDCCILGPVALSNFGKTVDINNDSYCTLCSSLVLAYSLLTGLKFSESRVTLNSSSCPTVSQYQLQEFKLLNAENQNIHNSYQDEMAFMDDIQNGRVEKVTELITEGSLIKLNQVGLFSKSSKKQAEYLACSVFTKSCIAAIRGGVPSGTAYALSDLAKQRLELCNNQTDILRLMTKMIQEFVQLVADYQDSKTELYYIEKCKMYITSHLNVDFCLTDIARHIGLSKSYLSRHFSTQCGMTITQYTNNERLNAASNMLKYSDIPIQEISNYLRFPSQSYFTKLFRGKFGITPRVYRNREKVIDFS